MWSKSVPGPPHIRHVWSRSRTSRICAAVILAARSRYRFRFLSRCCLTFDGGFRGNASTRSRIVVRVRRTLHIDWRETPIPFAIAPMDRPAS